MKRKILLTFLLTFFTLVFIPLAYGDTIVFGPEVYTRGTGKPQKIIKSFSVNKGHVPFALSIKNGDGKKQRVSSAVIEINGIQVLGPEEFDKQIDEIRVHIKLKEQNEIAVEVRGEPGTYITVTILGSSIPEILTSADPDYVNLNQPTTVTVSALIEPNLIPSSINLIQYDEKYRFVANLGILYDDGTHGDRQAGDKDFATQTIISESYQKMLHYRVSTVSTFYNDTLKKVLSDFFSINVAHIPSVTGVISPQGGTTTLEGYATVIFPAGAFPSNTTVKVMATSSPETEEDYKATMEIDETGPRLPYEIRINSGNVEPATSFDIVLNVPDSFINTLPVGAKIEVFVQLLHIGEYEALDNFYYGFSSTFDPATKTVRATIPKSAFTTFRRLDKTYEAIVVGTTLR